MWSRLAQGVSGMFYSDDSEIGNGADVDNSNSATGNSINRALECKYNVSIEDSEILNHDQMWRLSKEMLPKYYQMDTWKLLYSLKRDGSSMRTLLTAAHDQGPVIILVQPLETDQTICIGSFLVPGLSNHQLCYGTNDTRVFYVRKSNSSSEDCVPQNSEDISVFPSSNDNSFFIHCNDNGIGIGGGTNSNYSLHVPYVCYQFTPTLIY